MEYSYGFDPELQQDWKWTERYAAQPEILSYANHVADRFDLRPGIDFETEVESVHFDEAADQWVVSTNRGEQRARFVVMATRCLSSANTPMFPGRDEFARPTYHTGHWPHEPVDFSGQRVGVVGTGSSVIQAIPLIAEQAQRLTVFQRTANYAIPARNGPLDPAYVADIKHEYESFRTQNKLQSAGFGSRAPKSKGGSVLDAPTEERDAEFDFRWARGGFGFLGGYDDFLVDENANDIAAEYVRERVRDIVDDPQTAERLCPRQVIGCKRICLDADYFQTFNRPNVSLVDIGENPIERIDSTGLQTGAGHVDLDCLVFATGFDAMTRTLLRMDIRGVAGLTLRDKWEAGPRAYLGLTTAGFLNLFMISGPGSPSVLTNMIVSIEQHVEWVADCIAYIQDKGLRRIDAQPDAEDAWVTHVNAIADKTLYPTCNSWYLGANIPGKPRVFMPHIGFPPYAKKCADVAAAGYEGFVLA
jgi:cation diffusion facilitator CzcD-associated flavoprotein CzcO